MARLDAAYKALQEAERQAEQLILNARLEFGRAIRRVRQEGVKQQAIAEHFGWQREHVRRLQEAADIHDGIKPPADGTRLPSGRRRGRPRRS